MVDVNPDTIPFRNRGSQVAWAAVFAANLLWPIDQIDPGSIGGRAGMVVVAALVWTVGAVVIARSPAARYPLTVGGGVLALGQAFPLLQFYAGLLGWLCAGGPGIITSGPRLLTEIGWVVAAGVMGGLLFLAAWGIGIAVRKFHRWMYWVGRSPPGDAG